MFRVFAQILTKKSIKTSIISSVLNTPVCRLLVSSSVIDSKMPKGNPLVWIDMEMTGLDVSKDKVLEIACLVTDSDLNLIAEGPNLIIHQDDHTLDNMHKWCIEQHGKTGLTQACRESSITEAEAEKQVIQFLSKHVIKGQCPLAGNTVYMDRIFLRQYMPKISEYLHYRIVDVSSVKELCKSWYPKDFAEAPPKLGNHRALDDIRASVQELIYYRQTIFKSTK